MSIPEPNILKYNISIEHQFVISTGVDSSYHIVLPPFQNKSYVLENPWASGHFLHF